MKLNLGFAIVTVEMQPGARRWATTAAVLAASIATGIAAAFVIPPTMTFF